MARIQSSGESTGAGPLVRPGVLLAVFLLLGGCATSGAWRVPKLPKGETLTVLSLLPEAASVVSDTSTFAPDRVRLFPTGAWHINALNERWAIRVLRHQGQFRAINRPQRKIRRRFGPAQPGNHLHFSKPGLTARQLVGSTGTDLVLVIGPALGVEEGTTTAGPLMLFGALGGAVAGGLIHFLGPGYGVFQRVLLDGTRMGTYFVALRMWLLDGRTGKVIASMDCKLYSTRFIDRKTKTRPKAQSPWISQKGPVSRKNWSSVHASVRVFMKRTEALCLSKLKLG